MIARRVRKSAGDARKTARRPRMSVRDARKSL
jgi:hypothetical protein